MDLPSAERVLIAPLNWGLGHATRCIPIIRHYMATGASVHLASDGEALILLRREYPQLETFELPSYGVTYPDRGGMSWHILKQYPKIRAAMRMEEKWLATHLQEHSYDLIISDNRYGYRSAKVRSVFITHQLKVISPYLSNAVNRLHRDMIHRFDECWVPDHQGESSIAGELSQQALNIPTQYIGPLSRLERKESEQDISYLAVLSGPEPQRTRLEEVLMPILADVPDSVLVRGVMNQDDRSVNGRTLVIDHVDSSELEDLMGRAKSVICRSGYSSIMDLLSLKKKAILIPTPGQTEQEYLGERMKKLEFFDVIQQDDLISVLPDLLTDLSPSSLLS